MTDEPTRLVVHARDTTNDPQVLRLAARILRQNSRKPNGFWLGVLLRVLNDTADKIEAQHG